MGNVVSASCVLRFIGRARKRNAVFRTCIGGKMIESIEQRLCDLLNASYGRLSAPDVLPHKKERIIHNPGTLLHLGILSHIEEVKGANYD